MYLQTHNFHWNVTGPRFPELHLMFEEHYTELATAVDEIAERIRTLDVPAPGTGRRAQPRSRTEASGATFGTGVKRQTISPSPFWEDVFSQGLIPFVLLPCRRRAIC
jgi:DNA-binding ferritin-like protein